MRRDSTYVPSSATGSVRGELDNRSEAGSVGTVIHDGSFECPGHGLLVDGFPCETPAKLKQLLRPDESSGLIPISNHERRKKWWRAQCIHYGFRVPANATIDIYRAYLRGAIPHQVELRRPQEHIELEERLNLAYHDAKAHGKCDLAVTHVPASGCKRRKSEICDQVTEANKRVCVSERLPNPRTHTPIDLDVPRLNYLDVLRQHELNMFIGMYNLEHNEVLPTSRSRHAPTLVIAAGFDNLRFEGFIQLPGIMFCALVFQLGTFSKQTECRRITVRFKWRGKAVNKQNFIPSPSQVGQLTLDIEHRRLKGLIDGPVQARFKGTRINSAQRELSHRWEDLDVTSA
ncbi:unnamed protein product [Rhizoctonia solani]|uniref:Uncharacterized protein n=1 Tax=Rhizoctonia solani TaxID=456999 RepID=A0A8H3BE79_9AGAM|nr:unnamed protein product [Rhizoctonia solani]